ncbi:hypothetical protein ACSBR2_029537 [Camellia fascicularis]
MATDSARRLFQRSTSSAKASLSRKSRTQSPSNLGGLAPSSNSTPPSSVSRLHHSFFFTRYTFVYVNGVVANEVGLLTVIDASSLCYCFFLSQFYAVFKGWPMGLSL